MSDTQALDRRDFLGAAAASVVATALPHSRATSPLATRRTTPPVATVVRSLPVKQIDAGVLNVGYTDVGAATGPAVVLLHGWPYDIHSFADVVPLLTAAGYRVLIPHLRGFGTTRFRSTTTPRQAQQSALAVDTIAFMDALGVERATIAGFDWGSRTAAIVGALWPNRCNGLILVSGYLIVNREQNRQPLTPHAELAWWYQYYFATERGRRGYAAHRNEFNKLIWRLASPTWDFDDATFNRTAASFANDDHVDIVIHNYRWRLSLAEGDPALDDFEQRLAVAPPISVPTITIASDFDGAAADGASYAQRFVGRHAHRILEGVGHNVPQESPTEFAQAILDIAQ